MMEALSRVGDRCAEFERTEWPASVNIGKGVAFRRRSAGIVCKPPYAAEGGNAFGGER
jgi:hypothetical protein